VHTLNEEIGRIQDELARLEPEQRRIAVGERVGRALERLLEELEPRTARRLEIAVTEQFRKIADRRFSQAEISLPKDRSPEVIMASGEKLALSSFSGFEKRSFGIAFSLALAEITKRRIPLVIDTPLGNADSEYRPRAMDALSTTSLDQTIILTHDREVTPDLVKHSEDAICQTFLVDFQGNERGSIVYPGRFFGDARK